MNKKDLEYFKNKLISEKAVLENELNEVANRDPSLAKGWEAKSGNMDIDFADENEVADKFEELAYNRGVADKLEDQLIEINESLKKIEEGSYGLCTKCKEPIEKDRLEANYSAKTCIKHSH